MDTAEIILYAVLLFGVLRFVLAMIWQESLEMG